MNKVRTLALDPACFELDRALGDHAALPGASQGRGIFLPENWGTDEDEGEILWSLLFVLRFFSGVKVGFFFSFLSLDPSVDINSCYFVSSHLENLSR